MPNMPLDASDAIELAELLQFLAGWMNSDHDYLAPSLARYLGIDGEGHGPERLADDMATGAAGERLHELVGGRGRGLR
jgi:hypothetical protein